MRWEASRVTPTSTPPTHQHNNTTITNNSNSFSTNAAQGMHEANRAIAGAVGSGGGGIARHDGMVPDGMGVGMDRAHEGGGTAALDAPSSLRSAGSSSSSSPSSSVAKKKAVKKPKNKKRAAAGGGGSLGSMLKR